MISTHRLCVVVFLVAAAPLRADEVQPILFEQQVRPLLKAHCFECHGEGKKLKGGLDLRLRRTLVKGGDSGAVVVVGKPADSVLIQRLRAGEMPPGKKKLSADEVAILERWIAA